MASDLTQSSIARQLATVPNVFTLLRLVCIPVFAWLLLGADRPFAAAVVLGVVGATDWIDGYLARRLGQVTTVGKVFDPVVDRILIGVTVVCAIIDGFAPLWFTLAVLAREAIVTALVAYATAKTGKRTDVTYVGKCAAFGVMWAFPWFLAASAMTSRNAELFFLIGAWISGTLGLFFGAWSVGQYWRVARQSQ
jgi:cardiolipin synthase